MLMSLYAEQNNIVKNAIHCRQVEIGPLELLAELFKYKDPTVFYFPLLTSHIRVANKGKFVKT